MCVVECRIGNWTHLGLNNNVNLFIGPNYLNFDQRLKTETISKIPMQQQQRLLFQSGSVDGATTTNGVTDSLKRIIGPTGWLSMVLRLRQHNIGYTADGFYRSDDPTNSV